MMPLYLDVSFARFSFSVWDSRPFVGVHSSHTTRSRFICSCGASLELVWSTMLWRNATAGLIYDAVEKRDCLGVSCQLFVVQFS